MRDHKDGAPGNQILQGHLYQRFALGVERGSGFVEDQDGRVFQNGARNRDTLPFTTAQAQAAFADHRVIALGQGHDEFVGQRRAGRFFHRLGGNLRLPIGNVVAYRVVEQDGVLGNDGDLRAQGSDGQVAHVAPVDEQPPSRDIEEARQQMHQRSLACTAGADNRHQFARRYLQVDVVQHFAVVVLLLIAEVHMLEAYALMKWRQLVRARFLAHFVLGVEEIENRRGGAQRLLKVVVEYPKLAHRLVQLEHRDNECQEDAFGEKAVFNVLAADQDKNSDSDGAENVHHRRTYGVGADGAQVGFEQPPPSIAEATRLPSFHRKGFHDAYARDGFLQDVLDLSQLVLAAAGRSAHAVADPSGRHHHDRDEDDEHPRQTPPQQDHNAGGKKEGKKLLQKFRQHRRERKLHPLDVVHNRRQQCAGGIFLKERHRPAQRGRVEFVTQIRNHAVPGIVGQVAAAVIEDALQRRGGDQRKRDHRPHIVEVLGNKPVQLDRLAADRHFEQR